MPYWYQEWIGYWRGKPTKEILAYMKPRVTGQMLAKERGAMAVLVERGEGFLG